MVAAVALPKGVVGGLGVKEGLHAFHFEFHFDLGGEPAEHLVHRAGHFLFCVQGRADGSEQMGIVRVDHMLFVKLQGPDKSGLQFRQKVQRTAQKSHMPADGFSAGKAGNGLVYHSLEDGGCQIFLGGALVDQGLDICLRKNAASGCDCVERVIAFRIFVQAGGVCLDQRGHLVDKGTCAPGADTVHTLFHIAAFEVDDLGVLASQLDGHIGFGSQLLQRRSYGDDLLNERHVQTAGQSQSAGARDHGMKFYIAQLPAGFFQKSGEGLTDIGIVPFIAGKQNVMFPVQNCDFNCCGAYINAKECIGIAKECIGIAKKCTGIARECIGIARECIARQCVGINCSFIGTFHANHPSCK